MKNLLLVLLSLMAGSVALAQSVLSGKVIDADSKLPLEGASVVAQNTTMGTVTDSTGNFKLQLSKGGFELVVTYTGYNSKQQNIQPGHADSVIIELQKEDKSMSE